MAFVACAAVLIAAACARTSDETRIRDAIAAMRDAAEARHADALLDHVANDFTGQDGQLDRSALARLVKLEFLRSDGIGVALGPISLEIDGDRATARFDMTLTDRSRRWLPGGGATYAVVSGWRREGRDWACYNATWSETQAE